MLTDSDIEISFATLDDIELPSGDLEWVRGEVDALLASKKFAPLPASVHALAVFGSRTLSGDNVLDVIERHVAALHAGLIVTAAEPAGVCAMAQVYARKKEMPLQIHFLQRDKFARGAWEHRSDHVILASDAVLLIHDGTSKGTYNEIQRTIHFHKPFIYERLNKLAGEDILCQI